MKKEIYILTAVIFICGLSAAADYEDFEITFDTEKFEFSTITEGEDTYDLITYEDGGLYGPLGEPSIPVKGLEVLIPYGSTDVTVEVIDSSYTELEEEYYLYPGQKPRAVPEEYPFDEAAWEFTPPGPIYGSYYVYPENLIVDSGKGFVRGCFLCQWHAAGANYIPADKIVRLMNSITFRVSWTPPQSTPEPTRYEWEDAYDYWKKLFEHTALNPDDFEERREPVNFVDIIDYSAYEENGEVVPVATQAASEIYELNAPDPNDTTSKPSDKKFPYLYVIITNDYAEHTSGRVGPLGLLNASKTLSDWKTEKGIPATRRTVDWIKNNYEPGAQEYDDPQVRVRMFIEDAWRNWGTQYVICVGDVDPLPSGAYQSEAGQYGIVPIRCFWPEGGVRGYVPTDLYYDSLDEDWDKDDDLKFGENYDGDYPSFKPDLALGWLPCQTQTELTTWLNKLLKYEKDPDLNLINGRTYLSRFAQVGSDSCISPEVPRIYRTRWLIEDYLEPAAYECLKIWEGTGAGGEPEEGYKMQWPTYPEPGDVNEGIEEGYGIVELDTHGSPLRHYVLTQNEFNPLGSVGGYLQTWAATKDAPTYWAMIFPDSIAELENGPKYPVAYSWSCSSNKFMHYAFGEGRTVSEEWLFNDDGGGVAYLGNTNSGVFGGGSYLTWFFYKVLLNKTPPPQNPAQVMTDDDVDLLGLAQIWAKYWYSVTEKLDSRWYTVYVHLLAGEPEMSVYTGDPDALEVEIIGNTYEAGKTTVKVEVKEKVSGSPAYVAKVCLYKPNGFYLTNITNNQGHCEFVVDGYATGGKVTAAKHNCVPALATVPAP
jgi:hypothetical protein